METYIKNRLEELEVTRKDFWNLPHESGNFINMLIRSKGIKSVLEIGTSNGYSALWICEALKTTGGHLVSLEFWEKRSVLAKQNLEDCNLSEFATLKIGSALDLIQHLTPQDFASTEIALDLVFIDANKAEYIKYFELVHPLLKKGGIILADNITSHPEKTQPYVDAVNAHEDYQSELLTFDGGLLMSVKVN